MFVKTCGNKTKTVCWVKRRHISKEAAFSWGCEAGKGRS